MFSAIEQLSLSLQGKDTTVQELYKLLSWQQNILPDRTGEVFNDFYEKVVEDSVDLTLEPTLPQYAKKPRRIDDDVPSHKFENLKAYFRQMYVFWMSFQ